MHNREKYPEIWAAFERARSTKAALTEKRKVFTDEMDVLHRQIEAHNAPIKAELEELAQKAYADRKEALELSREISRMARAMGAKSMSITEFPK